MVTHYVLLDVFLIFSGLVAYSSGWYFTFKCLEFPKMEALIFFSLFGLFFIPIIYWIGFCKNRVSRDQRKKNKQDELERKTLLVERIAKAINSIPEEKWQVVRAEHLDQIVSQLSKKERK